MKITQVFLSQFLLLLFVLSNLGCEELTGTGTGNPIHCRETTPCSGTDSNASDPGYVLPEEEIENNFPMIATICQKIKSCNDGLEIRYCYSQVGKRVDFVESLGLEPEGDYGDMWYFWGQVSSGNNPAPDTAKLASCLSNVEGFACLDPEVQEAYNSDSDRPFDQVFGLLTPICQQIFD